MDTRIMDGFPRPLFTISPILARSREVISRETRTWTDAVASSDVHDLAEITLDRDRRTRAPRRTTFTRTPAVGRVVTIASVMAALVWTFDHDEPVASAARIHVRGSAKLTAQTARSDGDLILSGQLTDDAGEPIARTSIDLSLSLAADDPSRPVGDVADSARMFRPCRTPTNVPRGAAGGASPLWLPPKTDDAGEFCIRASLSAAKWVVHLGWSGSALVDAAKLDVPVDLERTPLSLRFDPAPRVVHLDEPIPLEVRARIASDMEAPATGLQLVLNDERGHVVAETNTDALGRAQFEVDPSKLAPPGVGSFSVTCRGEECPDGANASLDVERHATVQLYAHDERLRTEMQVPDEGLPLDVDVKTAVGPVNAGTVEALVGTTVVGAAAVKNGAAHLVLTFAAATDGDASIGLRYLPSSPWFEPGRGTIAHAQVKAKSGWRDSPFLAIGIVLLAWLILGRARTGAPKIPAPPPAKDEPRVLPELEVIASEDGSRGWIGRVVDAHDGTPLVDAEIGIERGGFAASMRLARARSDANGAFTLPAIDRMPGDAIVAVSRLHAELRQVLPPSALGGALTIRLVSRRYAIVTRLVAWSRARVRGDARLDPTPAQVKKSANTVEVGRWADAVERAAFGPDEVDRVVEASVDALAPHVASASARPPAMQPAVDAARVDPTKPMGP